MTSHAIATTVRSAGHAHDAYLPELGSPRSARDSTYVDGPDNVRRTNQDTGEDFWMYLQLRATPGTVNKCLAHLDRHLQAHPGADAEIVGIGADPRNVRVIIGVNLGDSFKVKTRPENVLAAYDFVQSLSANLANFWPQYLTGTPTDEERDLLASVVAAGTITTRPTVPTQLSGITAEADLFTFEPEREFVLDGTGGLWQVETAAA